LLALALGLAAACGNNNGSKQRDAGVVDAGTDGGLDASCFENPQTNYEIINACTTAEKIYKPGRPPLENSDGTLPPLP
jgi:hypothetical protein